MRAEPSAGARSLNRAFDRPQEQIEAASCDLNSAFINHRLLTVSQCRRSGVIKETNLLIRPNGFNHIRRVRYANTCSTPEPLPISQSVNIQLRENLIDRANEVIHLFESMTGCHCETETFFSASNGRVVYSLDVDVVFREELV